VPFFDRSLSDAQKTGHFLHGEHSGLAQAFVVALQPIGPPDVGDEITLECPTLACMQTAFIQDLGDLRIGGLIQQSINQLNHFR